MFKNSAIGARDGVEDASRARVRCAWAKFRELTQRGVQKVKGSVYRACVQSLGVGQ